MAENDSKVSLLKLSGLSLKVKSRRHCPVDKNLKVVFHPTTFPFSNF